MERQGILRAEVQGQLKQEKESTWYKDVRKVLAI